MWLFSMLHADDDADDSKSYVRPLLQLGTVTSVLVIRPGKQFSFQITTERGYQMTAAYRCWKELEVSSRWTVLPRRSCEDRIEASLWLEQQDHHVLPSEVDDDMPD